MSIIEISTDKQKENIFAINPKQVTSIRIKQMSESSDVKFFSEKKFLWSVTRKEGFYYCIGDIVVGNAISKEKLSVDYIITEDNKVFNRPSATIYLSDGRICFFTKDTIEEVKEKIKFISNDIQLNRVE